MQASTPLPSFRNQPHALTCACPQGSVLSFLEARDLARLSGFSSICNRAATQDPLWHSLLTKHLGGATPWAKWGATPAHQYRTLVMMPCTVCNKAAFRERGNLPRPARYSGPQFCRQCGVCVCARCSCHCALDVESRKQPLQSCWELMVD
jgi:hypothetical protein